MLAQVGLQLVLAAAAGPPSFRGQRGAPKSHPETRVHHFPEALSPPECESVRRLKGKAAEGVIKVGHTYEEEDSAKGSLRSTALQWLPQSTESAKSRKRSRTLLTCVEFLTLTLRFSMQTNAPSSTNVHARS